MCSLQVFASEMSLTRTDRKSTESSSGQNYSMNLSANLVPVCLSAGLLQLVPGIPLQTPGRSRLACWLWVSWSTFVSDFNWPPVESSKHQLKQNSCVCCLNCLFPRTHFIYRDERVLVALTSLTDWLTDWPVCGNINKRFFWEKFLEFRLVGNCQSEECGDGELLSRNIIKQLFTGMKTGESR